MGRDYCTKRCFVTFPAHTLYGIITHMNDVQIRITELQEKGWTLVSLAEELGVTPNAVEKWKAGDRYPANAKATLAMLGQLSKSKRLPKRRRHTEYQGEK